MKRIVLFVVTNLAVMLVLGLVVNLFGLNRFLTANGLNLTGLLAFSAVMGFGGAIISLLMSKPMAKWSTRAQVINDSPDPTHQWIVATVRRFADKAGISMPEVAIYQGEPNAFATGAFKNSALVAVSTGLLQGMNREEVEAVIGHEVAHVANGDMVTMTLIQGVMNTFVLDLLLGVLAAIIVAWFSRQREFRADRGAAQMMGNARPMQHALARLGGLPPGELPQTVKAMGIAGVPSGLMKLFSTHPPIEERIAALQQQPPQR
jgi:heat shock protein HtpX